MTTTYDPPNYLFSTGNERVFDLQRLVRAYFRHRKYQEPTSLEALAFLISEVGELCEAFVAHALIDAEFMNVLNGMIAVGELADRVVSERAGWVRNNEKKNTDLSGEIGDVLMMLTKLSDQLWLGDPISCMAAKMGKKGF